MRGLGTGEHRAGEDASVAMRKRLPAFILRRGKPTSAALAIREDET